MVRVQTGVASKWKIPKRYRKKNFPKQQGRVQPPNHWAEPQPANWDPKFLGKIGYFRNPQKFLFFYPSESRKIHSRAIS